MWPTMRRSRRHTRSGSTTTATSGLERSEAAGDLDVHGLPDLAQEREDVYAYLLQTSLHWIDAVHPDGFRLDAVKHISTAFWARYNDDILRHTGPGLPAPGRGSRRQYAEDCATLQEGHFTSLFDFPLHFAMIDVFCREASPEKLGHGSSKTGASHTRRRWRCCWTTTISPACVGVRRRSEKRVVRPSRSCSRPAEFPQSRMERRSQCRAPVSRRTGADMGFAER